jgi:hypothetical protein
MSLSIAEAPRLTSEPAVCSTDLLCPVAVLFARADSIYKTMPRLDVWDAERDARNWTGGCPVVAHPPCGPWGKLSNKCKSPEERGLALWALKQVRKWGGVLEHPEGSKLWQEAGLWDDGIGFTLKVEQHWWGHRARKRTWLYVCGLELRGVPQMPLTLTEASHVVSSGYAPYRGHRHRSCKPEIGKAEREHTPPAFARWLVELARRCKGHNKEVSDAGPLTPELNPKREPGIR